MGAMLTVLHQCTVQALSKIPTYFIPYRGISVTVSNKKDIKRFK